MQHFQYLTLKIHGQGQMTTMLHHRSGQFHRTSNGLNSFSGIRDMGSRKSGPSVAWFEKFLANGANGQITMMLYNYRRKQVHKTLNGVNPSVSEICVPQSLDPICGKFDKFLAHVHAHMGQMGKWPWYCTTTGLDNSTELRMEIIRQAVTEIWVPQAWQPPARTVTTIPLQPEELRGKN